MATLTLQRDLVTTLKKETYLNLGILSKLHPMSNQLNRYVFKEDSLEKPTQNVFNHLVHYLISIIDPVKSSALPWPLYDSKTEKMYRNEVSNFISDYSSKGSLSPVMSSYLVNPGCYKVTLLIFQLSQLALHVVFKSKMKTHQRQLYEDVTQKFNMQNRDEFIQYVGRETNIMLSKFSNYLHKRKSTEKIAEMFRKRITEMESKLRDMNPQKYINNLVDKFFNINSVNNTTKTEILKIKNIYAPSQLFETWLYKTDEEIDKLESEWDKKSAPLLELCRKAQENTEAILDRFTGEADRSSYTIEYNPKTDEICTKDLQNLVNTEQKYILKNIIKDGKLIFPNLVRGFIVAICFILKNLEIDNEIYKLNDSLEEGRNNYSEMVLAMKTLMERLTNAEADLQVSPIVYHPTVPMKSLPTIPPLLDLSDIRFTRDLPSKDLFDTYTPMHINKNQFSLHRKKPLMKHLKSLTTPFHQPSRENFLKTLISCHTGSNKRLNESQNIHNLSIIPRADKVNETIAECSSGFTKQQILRLLSTKKSSSSKKIKYKNERAVKNVKKGGLFNESNVSSESSVVLYRSQSSPNLFESTEKHYFSKGRRRKLSIMQEGTPPLLEMSGIAELENSCETPKAKIGIETRKQTNFDHKDDLFNSVNVDIKTANRILLPDLLSPSCNIQTLKTDSDLDELNTELHEIECKSDKKLRRSLGLVLGVDRTFLDEFDLID